jgi:exosome complex component RRP46
MSSIYAPPPTQLHPLSNPDGSATHTAHGYTVTAAVNGPIEVPARDALPDEAALEVTVRPAVGVGSKPPPPSFRDSSNRLTRRDTAPRERHLEILLARTLRPVVLARAFPRTLVQVTLQILRTPPAHKARFSHSVRPSTPLDRRP